MASWHHLALLAALLQASDVHTGCVPAPSTQWAGAVALNLLPPELRPRPPRETPLLLSAGGASLQVSVAVDCPSGSLYPDHVTWNYTAYFQNKSYGECKHQRTTMVRAGDQCRSTALFSGLLENTTYLVRAMPLANRGTSAWYKNTTNAPFTAVASATTCPRAVAPVEQLLVHAAGARWLALSWRPPAPACLTALEYRVRHFAALEPNATTILFRAAGAFHSNASWALEGGVLPCAAWPGRHCLLLDEGVQPGGQYMVHVVVRRTLDKTDSNTVAVTTTAGDKAPGPPEDLRCVRALPSELELRWRCPLAPGGALTSAHLALLGPDGTQVAALAWNVTLRAEYSRTVEGLRPSPATRPPCASTRPPGCRARGRAWRRGRRRARARARRAAGPRRAAGACPAGGSRDTSCCCSWAPLSSSPAAGGRGDRRCWTGRGRRAGCGARRETTLTLLRPTTATSCPSCWEGIPRRQTAPTTTRSSRRRPPRPLPRPPPRSPPRCPPLAHPLQRGRRRRRRKAHAADAMEEESDKEIGTEPDLP